MNIVSELTISALRQIDNDALVGYASCLSTACERYPPPFGMAWYGDKYREVASDPNWLAASLVANSQKEGEGSRTLWRLAGRTADVEMANAVRRHAVDESRHAVHSNAGHRIPRCGFRRTSSRAHGPFSTLWDARPTDGVPGFSGGAYPG